MVMRVPLLCHPETPCEPLKAIEVEVSRLNGRAGMRRLALRFVASGNIRALAAPHYAGSRERRDELWRHTCFEAFLRPAGDSGYHEFNLAPTGEWNCYRFADYRAGMAMEREAGEPSIEISSRSAPLSAARRASLAEAGLDSYERFEAPCYMLAATLELPSALLPLDRPWEVGLSAVIEERNGRLSYWALKHPPGKPDFHHRDCFALELPAAMPA